MNKTIFSLAILTFFAQSAGAETKYVVDVVCSNASGSLRFTREIAPLSGGPALPPGPLAAPKEPRETWVFGGQPLAGVQAAYGQEVVLKNRFHSGIEVVEAWAVQVTLTGAGGQSLPNGNSVLVDFLVCRYKGPGPALPG